jgi:hypothetical protein
MVEALATLADDQPAHHRRHHDRPFGVSVNLTHAKVAREPKPPAPRPTSAKPKQPRRQDVAPAIDQPSLEINGRVLAIFSNYDGLQNAMRARTEDLQLTRLELDYLSGNQEGYSSKLLCGMKKFGRQSLGNTLGAVGSYLALVEDPEQVAKLKAVIEALSALCAAVALGVTRKEFEQIAGFAAAPKKSSMGLLGDALVSAGCKLALVEDPEAAAKIMSRAKKRQRPLRPATRLPDRTCRLNQCQ